LEYRVGHEAKKWVYNFGTDISQVTHTSPNIELLHN
jgi:hypothetical protein